MGCWRAIGSDDWTQAKDAKGAHAGVDDGYPVGYGLAVIEIRETCEYAAWFEGLRDRMAKTRILLRLRRVSLGNFGDAKAVGEGVSELRVDYGPGYRVYFLRRGEALVVLLGGGDKSTQSRDIQRAIALSRAV